MAPIVGYSETHIQSGVLGDKKAVSCSGVPGNLGLAPAYIYCDFFIDLAASSDGGLYARPEAGMVKQTGMVDSFGDDWWLYLCAQPHDWSLTIPAGNDLWGYMTNYPDFGQQIWMSGYTGSNGTGLVEWPERGDMPSSTDDAIAQGFKKLPFQATDIETWIDGDTKHVLTNLYLICPVLYSGTADTTITMPSVKFSVDVTELISYRPGAILKMGESSTSQWGQWKSHNRPAGGAKIRKGSTWEDLVNIPNEVNYGQDATTRKNVSSGKPTGDWIRSPKIGLE